MPMPEIKVIKQSEHQAWDHYVFSHDPCGPYVTSAWKNSVEKSYGHKTFYLAAYDKGDIVGVLPLVLIKPFLSGGVLISLPFCDYGGITANNQEIMIALVNHALDIAFEMRAALEIRSPRPCIEIEQEFSFVQTTERCRMILELPDNSKDLWDSFKSKLRSQIKKGTKNGLTFKIGDVGLSEDFYHVFSRNMRDLGSPVHSIKWVNAVVTNFDKNARIGVVYKDLCPVAAGIVLMTKNTITIPWASTLREFNKLTPNMLLYWSFLEYATDRGFHYFDFGRSVPGEGTYVFKKQWGTLPVALAWYRISRNSDQKYISNMDMPLQKAVQRIWCRLPLAVTNKMGPYIRKYIDK